MDTAHVAALASRLADVAERVRDLEARLTSGLASTAWVGADHDRFGNAWTTQHQRALREAAAALDEASALASDNVREQESASA
jgi:hypothetical protein